MKRILCIVVLCGLVFMSAGCCINLDIADPTSTEQTLPETEPILATEPETTTEPVQTEPPATEPTETELPVTEPEPTDPPSHMPYTIKLYASKRIYRGPKLQSGYVRSVAENGIYTIVDEDRDGDGNLWGKLKSGVGWVLLEVNTAGGRQVCVRCGTTNEYAFIDSWVPGELCMGCKRDIGHFGEDGGVFCPQCYKDVSYMGLMEDGRCEECNENDP